MPDIHFDCPKCKQTLDAPEELATQLIECPTCKETIEVPVRSQRKEIPKPPVPPPPTPPTQPSSSSGRIVRKSEFLGVGAVVQAVGCVVILAGFALGFALGGFVIGVALLIIGGRMAYKLLCSNCGNKVSGAEVRICPVCKCHLQG
jgi:uncharacterized protein YbaR (Trm112 family)